MNKYKIILSICLILVITFSVFLPSLRNDFLSSWDDSEYIVNNTAIKSLSLENIKKIFTSFFASNYQPISILIYSIECHFFKSAPMGYHLTNLVLHLLNCLLVFWLICILSDSIFVSFITTILFAIHPLRVESVVWLSEQKDVLYSFFFIGSMISYCYYILNNRASKYYYFSLLLFLLSLLSKPMAITLPLILILIDYILKRKSDKTMLVEKIPFFELSVLFGIVAYLSHFGRRGFSFNLINKCYSAGYCASFYLKKIFMPVKLSCLYQYPKNIPVFSLLPVITFILIIILFFLAKRSRKIVFIGAFFFIILLPVLEFISTGGRTIIADRYTYISSIAICYAIGEGFVWLYRRNIKYAYIARPFLLVLLAGIIGILSVLTWEKCGIWKDNLTLWNDVLRQYPDNSLVYLKRGLIYIDKGAFDNSISDFTKALELRPGYADAYYCRGNVYSKKDEFSKAISDLTRAIEIRPDFSDAYSSRGLVYSNKGEFGKAISDFNRAIEINADDKLTYNKRGATFGKMGNMRSAILDFNKAVELDPQYDEAYYNRGLAYAQKGNLGQALSDFNKAIKINPDNIGARLERAVTYFYKKEYAKSWEDLHVIEKLGAADKIGLALREDLKKVSGREK